jgi:hypothetical protein
MAEDKQAADASIQAANDKAIEAARALAREKAKNAVKDVQKGPQATLQNAALAALASGAQTSVQSGFQKTLEQQAAAFIQPPAQAAPEVPPPEPLTEAEQAEYKSALERIQELQKKAYGDAMPPEGVPALRPVKKWRVRLDGVTIGTTAGAKQLVAYQRNTKMVPHPLPGYRPLLCPDGLDVVEATSEGEAFEKLKARFSIIQTEKTPVIVEYNSAKDRELLQAEFLAGVASGDDMRIPA